MKKERKKEPKAGDLVRLKSGGPTMVVGEFDDGGQLHRGEFLPATLVAA